MTVKNKYPFPKIDYLFDQMKGGKVFSKIDMGSSYHQVIFKEQGIHKISLRKKYGHYEFIVVPFGPNNAPTMFMCPINSVFNKYLDKFVLVLLDDILIYFKNEEEHEEHLGMVL